MEASQRLDSTDTQKPNNPAALVEPDMTIRQAVALLQETSLTAVPILDPRTGERIGILARPDTLASSVPVPPRLGGMATPLGVYLHDGVTGGGTGFLGLVSCGVLLATLAEAAQYLGGLASTAMLRALSAVATQSPHASAILFPLQIWANQSLLVVCSALLVLMLVRILPLSGTHAAEHQVVHCVEQGMPLTPAVVRSMPRIHPRCGTNLLAGLMLFIFVFAAVFVTAQIKGTDTPDCIGLGCIVAGPLVIGYWRRVGAFVQYWFTTKPATPSQIAGAIRAAEEVLWRRRSVLETAIQPRWRLLRRLWTMGMPQILVGYAVVLLVVKLATIVWPGLSSVLEI